MNLLNFFHVKVHSSLFVKLFDRNHSLKSTLICIVISNVWIDQQSFICIPYTLQLYNVNLWIQVFFLNAYRYIASLQLKWLRFSIFWTRLRLSCAISVLWWKMILHKAVLIGLVEFIFRSIRNPCVSKACLLHSISH